MGPGTIDDLLAAVFPSDVIHCSAMIGSLEGELYPEELACIRSAVARRKHEFLTGRLCGRRLLARLGYERHPLIAREDRTAGWPPDVIGSIAHSAAYCAVAVARKERISSLGLDVETPDPLPAEDWTAILAAGERDWIDGRPAPERGGLAKLLFCAKESVFKCQFPVTRRYLDFTDVQVVLSMDTNTFTASPVAPEHSGASVLGQLRGRYRVDPRAVVSGAILPS